MQIQNKRLLNKCSSIMLRCFKRLFNNMKKTGLYGYVYDFSVDYDSIHFDILAFITHLLSVLINVVEVSILL